MKNGDVLHPLVPSTLIISNNAIPGRCIRRLLLLFKTAGRYLVWVPASLSVK
jgi:ABC-type microcin C transport system permease subunit YejB